MPARSRDGSRARRILGQAGRQAPSCRRSCLPQQNWMESRTESQQRGGHGKEWLVYSRAAWSPRALACRRPPDPSAPRAEHRAPVPCPTCHRRIGGSLAARRGRANRSAAMCAGLCVFRCRNGGIIYIYLELVGIRERPAMESLAHLSQPTSLSAPPAAAGFVASPAGPGDWAC